MRTKRFDRDCVVGFAIGAMLDAWPVVRGKRRAVMLRALRVLVPTTKYYSLDRDHWALLRSLKLEQRK